MILKTIFLVFAFQLMTVFGEIWSGYDPREIFKASDRVLMSFETTFTTEDQKKCIRDFNNFTKDLASGREWTEKMINSYGRLPQGIYSDNKIDYGYFDQCLKIKTEIDIKPQYCLLPIENRHQNQSISFQIGICVPDSCSTTQVQQIMKSLLNKIGYTSDKMMDECVDTTPKRFGLLERSAILVVSGIILIIFISTVYEIVQKYRNAKTSPLMTSFSLQRNLTYLFEPKQDPNMIECINGIRVFTDGWIIVFHLYFFMRNYMRSVHNPEDLEVWKNSIWNLLTLQSHLAVDTCFLIGGLCLSYNFMIAREQKNNFNLLKFYLHRYIRLTPAYGATMVLLMFVYNVRPGPVFEPKNYMGQDSCRRYWWAVLIYSQIYTNCDEPCMPVTWYLNVDMHLTIISPILLFALWKFGYKCMSVIIPLVLYSVYQLYTLSMTHQITITEMFELTPKVAMKVYCPTHVRYATWLMGVTLGFILYKKRNTPSTLSTFKNVYIWINVIILAIYTIIGVRLHPKEWQNDVQMSAYGAAPHRVMWTLCMAWIVYACIRGRGGFINWFFSLPYWKPIAKLNYCNYLIHQAFIVLIVRLLRVELHFDGWIFLIMALGIYFFSLILSIPWTLMFEIPFLNVEKAIWGIIEERKTKENTKKVE